MKILLIITLLISSPFACHAGTKAIIAGRSTILSESDFDKARENYNGDSFPRQKSRLPLDIQRKVLDLIGMHELVVSSDCKTLKIEKVVLLRESGDVAFSKEQIKKGTLTEDWFFQYCGKQIAFQILCSAKAPKDRKLSIIALNSKNEAIDDPNRNGYSY